jgi:hypothetical protein
MNEHKTKEDILESCGRLELGVGDFVYTDSALKAMQLYADQQTSLLAKQLAEKDKEIERLKFMIEHGLGWEDLQNDITMPHEI